MSAFGRAHADWLSPLDGPEPSPQSEALWALLEEAGVDEAVIQKASDLLDGFVGEALAYYTPERLDSERLRWVLYRARINAGRDYSGIPGWDLAKISLPFPHRVGGRLFEPESLSREVIDTLMHAETQGY